MTPTIGRIEEFGANYVVFMLKQGIKVTFALTPLKLAEWKEHPDWIKPGIYMEFTVTEAKFVDTYKVIEEPGWSSEIPARETKPTTRPVVTEIRCELFHLVSIFLIKI